MIAEQTDLIPVVAYYRQSTDDQKESIPDQRRAVAEYCERKGYHIEAEFQDVESGWKDTRIGFKQLMDYATGHGHVQAVVVWSQCRFSRFDFWTFAEYANRLRRADVAIDTVQDGKLDLSEELSAITSVVSQMGKRQYSRDLAHSSHRGSRERALAGKWVCGRPPLGYVVDDEKRLQLGEPSKVALVRRIFDLYLSGQSVRGITLLLNEEGVPSSKGGKWCPAAVRNMLKNVAYIGVIRWGDRQGSEFVKKGELVFVRDAHPAIISGATFERVQQRMQECAAPKRRTRLLNGGPYVFTGLLWCGQCGGRMTGKMCHGKPQYSCYRYRFEDRTACQRNTVQQDELLNEVVGSIEDYFSHPDTLARLRDSLREQFTPAAGVSAEAIRQELDQCQQDLDRLLRRLTQVDDEFVSIVQNEIRSTQRKLQELTATLAAAERPQDAIDAQVEEMVELSLRAYRRLREALQAEDYPLLRDFLHELIDRVEVWCEPGDMVNGQQTFRLVRGRIVLRDSKVSKHTRARSRDTG